MKKTTLWIVALFAVVTLAGCNNSINVETQHDRISACAQAVGKYFEISDYSISWDAEEEAWASYVLNWLVNIWNALEEDMVAKHVECVIDMVDKSVSIQEGSAEIANPASIFCEKKGGTLQIETAEDWGQYWICLFDDGSYCEEWSYFRGECQAGEIIYNTVEENSLVSELYSDEDLAAAEAVIMNIINNQWNVKVESVELAYAGDEVSASNLGYCKELANAKWKDVDECIVFTSSFYIPEQDAPMAGAFEPNANIAWYGWYLGRATAGEWEVLTNGFG